MDTHEDKNLNFNSILNNSLMNMERAKESLRKSIPVLHNPFDNHKSNYNGAFKKQVYGSIGGEFRDKTDQLRQSTSNYDSDINDILERHEAQTNAIEKLQQQIKTLSHNQIAGEKKINKLAENVNYLTKTLKVLSNNTKDGQVKKYIKEKLQALEVRQNDKIHKTCHQLNCSFQERHLSLQQHYNSMTNTLNTMQGNVVKFQEQLDEYKYIRPSLVKVQNEVPIKILKPSEKTNFHPIVTKPKKIFSNNKSFVSEISDFDNLSDLSDISDGALSDSEIDLNTDDGDEFSLSLNDMCLSDSEIDNNYDISDIASDIGSECITGE